MNNPVIYFVQIKERMEAAGQGSEPAAGEMWPDSASIAKEMRDTAPLMENVRQKPMPAGEKVRQRSVSPVKEAEQDSVPTGEKVQQGIQPSFEAPLYAAEEEAETKSPASADPDDGREMDLDEFAQFACKYASEIDCSITGKSLLALYERIEMMEEDDVPLTKTAAIDLIEAAADKAEKPSIGRKITGLFSPKYDKEGLLILHENDFFD